MHLGTFVIPLLTAALTAASMGCSVAVSPSPPVGVETAAMGTMTLRWTVTGTTSPSACAAYGATLLEVVVYDAAGNEVAHANQGCGAFGITLDLPDGTYTAEVTLIDSAGNARSVTKPLHAIEVVTGTDIAIDLDFPAASFL